MNIASRPFRVIETRSIASDAVSLTLEPADGEAMFAFAPGQFMMVHLFNPDGSVWAKTAYSIATAPVESKDRLEIGVRNAGDFTSRLRNLAVGDTVGIQGPYGAFTLRDDAKRSVFFAGGIGITSIRSMIRQLLLTGIAQDVHLFYSCRDRETMAYEQEFRDLAARHPSFRFIPILTREKPDAWDGETGRLSADMIKKHLADLDARFYVCGPKEFMSAAASILEDLGVDVKTRMLKEVF